MILISPEVFTRLRSFSANEAKRAIDFVDKFQKNPKNPGISLERVTNAIDPDLWSGRVTQELRAILHKGDTWTILLIDHHDDAYRWAESRKVARNPATGALQIVETPEVIEQTIKQRPATPDEAGIFDAHKDDYILSLGLPENWLPTIRKIKSEDILLEAVEQLPPDVGERLLRLADGKFVTPPTPISESKPVTESPDTLRRFFLLEKDDELKKILEAPLHAWLVFLHPSQQALAYGNFNGPIKVTGSAGTGKTVVALHRAKYLASGGQRVLLTSYVTTLCENLGKNIKYLCSSEELGRITVAGVHKTALDLLHTAGIHIAPANKEQISGLFESYIAIYPMDFDIDFLFSEWENVIQDQGISSWDEYRSAPRKGLGHALKISERKQIWECFARALEQLDSKKMLDYSQICREARSLIEAGKIKSPFDAVVVDEVQDLKSQELRFLASLTPNGSLLLAGDGGQRIYAKSQSLKSLGINVTGRSRILKINYRTTAEIRKFADSVLGNEADDLDGARESRAGTKNLLNGPTPQYHEFATAASQASFVAEQIASRIGSGLMPEDCAVFARKRKALDIIKRELHTAGIASRLLTNENDLGEANGVVLGTMHRAKGLEFKFVVVIDASEEILPLRSAFHRIVDPVLKEDAIQRERQLFYVSLTRARDELLVCWVGSPTQFLENAIAASNSGQLKATS